MIFVALWIGATVLGLVSQLTLYRRALFGIATNPPKSAVVAVAQLRERAAIIGMIAFLIAFGMGVYAAADHPNGIAIAIALLTIMFAFMANGWLEEAGWRRIARSRPRR